MPINIRPMTPEDKPGIMRMLRLIPEFKPAEVVIAKEVIDSYLGDTVGSGYNILVAGNGLAIVGYVCFGPTPLTEGTWDIYWIAVAPDKQGQQIGSTLLAAAEKAIRESRGRLAIIETSALPSYARTRDFYSRHGYELIARLTDFYSPGDDKLILQKRF